MDPLELYVDQLFKKYKYRKDLAELKQEILTNLQDKKSDLISNGMSEEEALKEIKQSFPSVEPLIEDEVEVYTYRFHLEKLQTILILLCIGLIASAPVLNMPIRAALFRFIMILALLVVGIIYLIEYRRKDRFDETGYVSLGQYAKLKKYSLLLWIAFICVSCGFITLLLFGSNIWFHRPVRIDGPYAFYQLVMNYYDPLLTVLIPIGFHKIYHLIERNEVGE